MKKKQFSINFGGKSLIAEFSPMADQANGSVLVKYGETVIFATAVMSKRPREGGDFFPLVVDYEEKYYAAGRILGSRFVRREGRPSEEAVLISRMIDRSIRPLFDHRLRHEVQVVVMALAIDEENDPDVPAVIAASLALGTSDIPWVGPIGCVRAIKKDESLTFNPVYGDRKESLFDTFFCGVSGHINMIEAEAKEVPEEELAEAFQEGQKEIEKIVAFQNDIIAQIGKPKTVVEFPESSRELIEAFAPFAQRLETAIYEKDKQARTEEMEVIKDEWFKHTEEIFSETPRSVVYELFEKSTNDIVHKNILSVPGGQEKRADGRGIHELRPLFAQVHLTDRNHGSALFFRGETHILSVATLGAPGDALLIEGMEVQEKRSFIHHYNFPPFSVGEVRPLRGPGRREIGHGALVEKALRAVIPTKEEFPYTLRVVSETLSSNGSSSMASTCASSMALMDAGVPIKAAVAGASMGLMMDKDPSTGNLRYKVLTDIQGVEDHLGDMDFKVAGSRRGVTAIQMDIKVEGVTMEIIQEAFTRAKDARLQILDFMDKEIHEARKELSIYAPRIITITIKPDKIREVIGPGGKVINEIIEQSGAQIDIEQDGTVFITGSDEASAKMAQTLVEEIVREFEIGQRFEGKVSRIFNFGAMVEIAPRTEGLVHISEIAPFRVGTVTDVVDVGDTVPVEIISIDELGRINLSIKKVATLEAKKGNIEGNNNSHNRQHRNNS